MQEAHFSHTHTHTHVPADNYWLLQVPTHLQVVAKSLRHWLAEMKLDPQWRDCQKLATSRESLSCSDC